MRVAHLLTQCAAVAHITRAAHAPARCTATLLSLVVWWRLLLRACHNFNTIALSRGYERRNLNRRRYAATCPAAGLL